MIETEHPEGNSKGSKNRHDEEDVDENFVVHENTYKKHRLQESSHDQGYVASS